MIATIIDSVDGKIADSFAAIFFTFYAIKIQYFSLDAKRRSLVDSEAIPRYILSLTRNQTVVALLTENVARIGWASQTCMRKQLTVKVNTLSFIEANRCICLLLW